MDELITSLKRSYYATVRFLQKWRKIEVSVCSFYVAEFRNGVSENVQGLLKLLVRT